MSVVWMMLMLVMIAASRKLKSRCKDEALEVREEYATVIFTGTVWRVFRTSEQKFTYSAEVKVRRVLKGGDHVNADTLVVIDEIGTPLICRNRVREKDTRIFFLTQGVNHLRFNSSVIRMTMANLLRVMAAVKVE
uniref:NtA domain-containing protein n=1 Tax=Strigamia maritima TaxID=126957 RepID=T1ISD8_STRMM